MFSLNQYQKYAPSIVRIAISLVFLWFGINQLLLPEDFLGYLPQFLLELDYAETLVRFNGLAEIILGGLLLVGFLIRPVSLLLAIHLLGIIISLGYNDIAVRDFGLLLVTLSIFIGGRDLWSLDYRRKKQEL